MAKQRRQKGREINGILVLDKARGMSSNGCLQQVKRLFEARKAGHTGSLDPLATGVLPLCFGEATKVSQFLLDADKRYRSRFRLGIRTDSGDSEGQVINECEVRVTEEEISAALQQFRGNIEQMPPMYSALKHNGTPLYKLAREGKTVERKARPATIYAIELLSFEGDEAELEIHCSKGTYVRTIVDDLGEALGCGAHVTALRRTMAGAFNEAHCVTIGALEERAHSEGIEGLDAFLFNTDHAVPDLPSVILPGITAGYLTQGQPVMVRHLPTEGLVRLYREEEFEKENQFIGIGTVLEDGRVAPRRLIAGT